MADTGTSTPRNEVLAHQHGWEGEGGAEAPVRGPLLYVAASSVERAGCRVGCQDLEAGAAVAQGRGLPLQVLHELGSGSLAARVSVHDDRMDLGHVGGRRRRDGQQPAQHARVTAECVTDAHDRWKGQKYPGGRRRSGCVSGREGSHRDDFRIAYENVATAERRRAEKASREFGLHGEVAAEHPGHFEGVQLHEQAAEGRYIGRGRQSQEGTARIWGEVGHGETVLGSGVGLRALKLIGAPKWLPAGRDNSGG